MTRKIVFSILILLVGFADAHASAANSNCEAVLRTAPLVPKPAVASESSFQTIDRISARIEIAEDARGYFGILKESSIAGQKFAGGSGHDLLRAFKSHVNENSPTALRVEEKAIVLTQEVANFLKSTASSKALQSFNGGEAIRWSQRDTPRAGFRFLTLTEYGGQVLYTLPQSQISFVAKARYRKYYEFPIGDAGDLSAYKPVLSDLTALEVKMTSLTGPGGKEFLAEPETVFKPRIMVTNEIADRLKALRGNSADFEKDLIAIRDDLIQLKIAGNEEKQVIDLFAGLALLLKADPEFLKPSLAIAYERESYRLESKKGEFQFTADTNVRMYEALPTLATSDMKDYLAGAVTFQSAKGESFVEMKSPVGEKQRKDALYTTLFDAMNLNHLAHYRKGSGKKSVAKFLEQAITDETMDRTLFDQGIKLWIVKGLASLNSLPKKNDLVTMRDFYLALPFTDNSGNEFKLGLSYRPIKSGRDGHSAVLNEIRLIDKNGNKVKMNPSFDQFVEEMVMKKDARVVGLAIDRQVLPFPVRLDVEQVRFYSSFLMSYFAYDTGLAGNVRSLDGFGQIQTKTGLAAAVARLKGENAIKWIVDRTQKVAMAALLTVGALTVRDYYVASPVQESPVVNVEQISRDGVTGASVRGFKTDAGVEVILYPAQINSQFVFSVDSSNKNISNESQITLQSVRGEKIVLTAVGIIDGKKMYSLGRAS